MDGELDYEKVILQVDAAPEVSETASISIDISAAFGNSIEMKELRYEDVSALIEGAETKKAETQPEAKPQPEVQVQAAAVPIVPKHEVGKEMAGAAIRLRGMIGGVGKEFEESVTKRIESVEDANLVMPTLSTQDQLSDLEKIEGGIDAGLFDKEQTDIIVQEVNALSRIIARQDTSGLSDDEKEIALMRDQKVKEIKVRLHLK